MNVGWITSSIIAGILTISLVALTSRVYQSSGTQTLYHAAKLNANTISEIITHDLRKAGNRGAGDPILYADENEIRFQAVLERDAEPVEVIWRYHPDDPLESIMNSDAHHLERVVDGEQQSLSHMVVTDFQLTYYDENGQETIIESEIRRIHVKLRTESSVPYGDHYPMAVWESSVTPRNLALD